MKMKQNVILLLIFSLLLNLAACGSDPSNNTQSDPTPGATVPSQLDPPTVITTPTETTVPEPDHAALYFNAAAELAARNQLSMSVSYQEEMTVSGNTFLTEYARDIIIQGQGSDDLRMSVEETATYGSYETEITEIFVGGTAYTTVYGSSFSTEMTAEEFTSRHIPTIPVDGTLYSNCIAEETEDGTVLHFSDAVALESWLCSDATELTEATATATLSPDGELLSITYTAAYRCASATCQSALTVAYTNATEAEIQVPDYSEECIEMEYFDAPRLLEQAFGYLSDFQDLSFRSSTTTYVSAASYYWGESVYADTYMNGNSLQAKLDTEIYAMDYNSNEETEYKQEELYKKGSYSISIDGGTPETSRTITATAMSDYILSHISEYILDCGYMDNAVCTDLGSLVLVEFSCSEEMAQLILKEICADLFNDEDLLDTYATAYRTEQMQYYIAFDKYLGLPTAIGVYYEGTHTIDGTEFPTIRQVDQYINLASQDAYEAIFEVSAPDVEPENKATPVFYHVTGPNGEEMWLLGTIHVGDDRTGYLPQEILDAYHASDALAVECNTRVFDEAAETDNELAEAVSNAYYYDDGSTAADHMEDAKIYDLAVKYMKATGNYSFNAPYMKVAIWASSIENFSLVQAHNLSSDKGVDNRLLMMAEADGKKILEVESNLFQIEMLTGWSDELSNLLLLEAMAQDSLAYAQSLTELFDMWCAGDEATLIAYLNEEDTSELTEEEKKLYEEYNNAMSTDRNADMIKVAIDYLQSGETVFYAVGLAHVLADDGLVNGLRDAGYTVELVIYE